MHARQSVTSLRETKPAGNSEKSNRSLACFAFKGFAAFALFEVAAFLDATAFLLAAAAFFVEDFFDDFLTTAFLLAAFFDFFAAVFDLLLVAAI